MHPVISDSGLATADHETRNTGDGEPRQAIESEIAHSKLVLSSPDRGAVYRLDPSLPRDAQRIPVSARSAGSTALVDVTLLVDGQPISRFSQPPYETLWRLRPGRHVFMAEGVDAGGERVQSDKVWVEVRE
jgi:hypothetical protein